MQTLVKSFSKTESGFTTLLTFFLGFYVTFLMARWWQQVSGVPTVDEICQTLHGLVGVDSDDRKKEDNIKLQKEFKRLIARYCLLAWAMCLSGFSLPLKEKFPSEREYIKKRLMTMEEYLRLNSVATKGTVDGWTDKWFIPLNWAALALNKASSENDDKSKLVPAEHKFMVSQLNNFQAKLVKLTDYFEMRMPVIQTQVMHIAVWVFLILGIIAGQGTICGSESGGFTAVALLLNFPFFQLMKYLLIFGWLQAAKYVQLPFGSDTG